MAQRALRQPVRLAILVAYVVALFGLSRAVFGSWLPPDTSRGLWFYAGLAAILIGKLLDTPHFSPPADTICNVVAALTALLPFNPWLVAGPPVENLWTWTGAVLFLVAVLLCAAIAVFTKDARQPGWTRVGKTAFLLSTRIGSPTAIYSPVVLFALVAFHRHDATECLWIAVGWVVIIALHPLEVLALVVGALRDTWSTSYDALVAGELVGHQHPGLIMFKTSGPPLGPGDVVLVTNAVGSSAPALVLDHLGFSDGSWMRAVELPVAREQIEALVGRLRLPPGLFGRALRLDSSSVERLGLSCLVWSRRDRLVGLVAEDSDINRLRANLVRPDCDLAQGALLEVEIGADVVLYQVINASTQDDALAQKSRTGWVRVDAKQIGRWSGSRSGFEPVPWLPSPNAPVFVAAPTAYLASDNDIGRVPNTSYGITVDVNSLVTHNTAILGILGVGKSYLALELIERLLQSGIKVIALVVTRQYAEGLRPYRSEEWESKAVADLQRVGPPGKTAFKQNVEEGGSVGRFRELLGAKLAEFLGPAFDGNLLILDPSVFDVWRQDGRITPTGAAAMASLTPVQITQIVTELALELLRDTMSTAARCCLVYEEAHSLVPEWNSVVTEGDKTATQATVKAILQGRKHGLGCIAVTQRTAHVSKGLLNQCNTVFAMRIFDSTGMEFLANYIGRDYSSTLSTLEDRHAVVFGRASSCRNPVLVRLNDREDFLRRSRPEDVQEQE